jgi:hypothetical protein
MGEDKLCGMVEERPGKHASLNELIDERCPE